MFVEALANADPSVRAGGAAALYWIASCAEEAAGALGDSLNDENRQVRRLAGLALGRIGNAAEPHLVAALKHKDAPIRTRAVIPVPLTPYRLPLF